MRGDADEVRESVVLMWHLLPNTSRSYLQFASATINSKCDNIGLHHVSSAIINSNCDNIGPRHVSSAIINSNCDNIGLHHVSSAIIHSNCDKIGSHIFIIIFLRTNHCKRPITPKQAAASRIVCVKHLTIKSCCFICQLTRNKSTTITLSHVSSDCLH